MVQPARLSTPGRSFGLSTTLLVVLLSAICFAGFRKSIETGLCATTIVTAGFFSVGLANHRRRIQHRPPLSIPDSIVGFLWAGLSSIAWIAAGALTMIYPAMCLVGDTLALSELPIAAGTAGGIVGLVLSVFRSAIWGSEQ